MQTCVEVEKTEGRYCKFEAYHIQDCGLAQQIRRVLRPLMACSFDQRFRSGEELLEVFFFQFRSSADRGTFISVRENKRVSSSRSKLKRIECADQRSYPVYAAGVVSEEHAFSTSVFPHFISVGFRSHCSVCKIGNRFSSLLRDPFGFKLQHKYSPSPHFSIATTYRASFAYEIDTSRIFENQC